MSDALNNYLIQNAAVVTTVVNEHKNEEYFIQKISEFGHYIKKNGNNHILKCPWDDAHSTGHAGDGSTVMGFNDGKVWFKCHHQSCGDKKIPDFLSFFNLNTTEKTNTENKLAEKLEFTSIDTILKKPEVVNEFLVRGLLDLSGTSIVGGKPKSGKTTFAKALCYCVATGKTFLDCETKQGTVLYLALEDKESELKKSFLKFGCTGVEPIYFHISRAPSQIISELEKSIKAYNPKLVVIDTLFKAIKVKDNNAYSEVIEALSGVEQLARKNSVHIMSLHHLNKNGLGGTDAMLGSTGISASADSLVFINRETDGRRTISTIQRYGEDIETTGLNIDAESNLPILGVKKSVSARKRTETEIIELFKDEKVEMLFEEIAPKITGKEAFVRSVLNELIKDGFVLRAGRGVKHDPHYYMLNEKI